MRITELGIDNFLRIGRLRIKLDEPKIHLFCGHNEVGKTSLQEAIRFCLLGETQRIALKRDYKMMIKDGSSTGEVRVTLDGDRLLARDVASGKGSADQASYSDALGYLLDATRYPWLKIKERRAFMFELLNVTLRPTEVRERLKEDKGIEEGMADLIMPMLRAGFDAAHNYCREKATESRGAWKGITGEQYGVVKARGWTPAEQEADLSEHTDAIAELHTAKAELEAAAKKYGADAERKRIAVGHTFPCPNCGKTICIDRNHEKPVRIVEKDEITMTPEEEMEQRRAEQEMEEGDRKVLEQARRRVELAETNLQEVRAKMERAKNSEQVAAQAAACAKQVAQWIAAAEALAPDGIPAQMIAEKLQPLNDHLRETAMMTGWPQVSITPEMEILVDNRLFALQSESSQWRAQAAIAEAISVLSKIGMLILDRMDVLDLKNRASLIKWLMKIRERHNTILLFGTFKTPPRVPSVIAVHWMEAGAIVTEQAA